ncbi:DEAD/DEAH box helicase [Eubacterium oxidoreducens]|uniref:Helicase conserved C-terminal domain-containing protein n=1 Tax=Eubacterium oxidoreducens TaxID=1732 RepID=A0A1G6AVP9_EUBOX|nr:DEAD/DEAH box helicase [Eubacterium oxidoreducens]SDB12450.1 Helicase conserved C-terminal domain-containing protein [Eubacterium oxidoreducens]
MNSTTNLRDGLECAFIDSNYTSNLAYKPQFVSNNYKEGKKVISSIEEELLACEHFQISVAFITLGGITPLLQILQELERREITGEILTTNYLNFSEPRALKKLHELKNITIRMYDVERAEHGFHTKGYIFKNKEIYRVIIGSSNMTGRALTVNKEWNTKIVSTEQGEMAQDIVNEFRDLWNSEYSLEFEEFYEEYKERYKIIKHQREIAKKEKIVSFEKYKLQPNAMQVGFIQNLRRIIANGEERALLISATGTGKTYASAFAMRELGFKRVLFLVHRNFLAEQTMKSYQKVFAGNVSMGIVGAGKHECDADYIFATVQTLGKDTYLKGFAADAFDCIILDEAHHSSADTYQKVMDYFTPKLWLGMTATPDKRDDNIEGRNIYENFHYQIAYEIRLQQAMEEELLCPFHYFGISDLSMIDDAKITNRDFNLLTADERVKHIAEQAEYFSYSGNRVKGLVFCSRIEESRILSEKFNCLINPTTGRHYRTIALNGDASEAERREAFDRLAMEEYDATEEKTPLDYIFSVEILNEGVDIVEINQVIMLRPTQSPIVFIQQLGRGLRKAEGKEYVVILDFIGNYEHNFMIPIALSGDRTYNKDNIRRYVMEGGRVIPGVSTVHFDEISRKRIFESVDRANFSDLKLIKENYTNLKNKLGRIPALCDFDRYGEMDVLRIFDNQNLGSYYKFLVKYEKEYKIRLSQDEEKVIEFISKKLASGKRIQELQLLKKMLTYTSKSGLLESFANDVYQMYGKNISQNQMENIINVMTNEFPAGSGKKTYAQCVFLEKQQDDYTVSTTFSQMLLNEEFRYVLEELVDFGISRYERDYRNNYAQTDLVLYQKYTYEDVCRLLNWETNEVPLNIGGYKFDKKTKTFPVFINYEKADDISDSTKYEDHFTSSKTLIAISKSGRSLKSDDVQNFLQAKERGIQVELFVRKNKDDRISKEFYYLGHMMASGKTREFTMANTNKTAVEIEWILDEPVREDLYEYIVNG